MREFLLIQCVAPDVQPETSQVARIVLAVGACPSGNPDAVEPVPGGDLKAIEKGPPHHELPSDALVRVLVHLYLVTNIEPFQLAVLHHGLEEEDRDPRVDQVEAGTVVIQAAELTGKGGRR